MKKNKSNKKLASAAAMLLLSAAMLGTSTYAWFTMNKEVKVTGMQMKAHAEEGLLINEVAAHDSNTWDEEAKAGDDTTYTALRPASTKDLTNWWHANSKKTNNEAGYGSGTVDETNTVKIGDNYYTDIKPSAVNTKTFNENGVAGTNAQKDVYFTNATFGTNDGSGAAGYDDGEGYYVRYTYYLKSSDSAALNVAANKLQAKVTATVNADDAASSGASTALDKSLRVGIMMSGTNNFMIFAPVSGADTPYSVTGSVTGTGYTTLAASADNSTKYTQSTDYVPFNSAAIDIPNVNTNGIPVYVYIWFEGEDSNCKSDNLTTTLDRYEITVNFRDADILTP
ncbi:MAG: hypothetical protein K6E28_04105 [Eubacterium sp.]|nr:hypothetical protein [Eubacterium sp.]